jgi:hypothetical protein
VRKVGLQPIQRDGLDYEFDVVLDIDQEHRAAITKTRCSALADQVLLKPGPELGRQVREWLSSAPASVSRAESTRNANALPSGTLPNTSPLPAPTPRPEAQEEGKAAAQSASASKPAKVEASDEVKASGTAALAEIMAHFECPKDGAWGVLKDKLRALGMSTTSLTVEGIDAAMAYIRAEWAAMDESRGRVAALDGQDAGDAQ